MRRSSRSQPARDTAWSSFSAPCCEPPASGSSPGGEPHLPAVRRPGEAEQLLLPAAGQDRPAAGAIDDHVAAVTTDLAHHESEAVAPWRDAHAAERAFGDLQKGLADRVLEPEGFPGVLPTDDGDLARRAPVGVEDVLGDVAQPSSHQWDAGESSIQEMRQCLSAVHRVHAPVQDVCFRPTVYHEQSHIEPDWEGL